MWKMEIQKKSSLYHEVVEPLQPGITVEHPLKKAISQEKCF